MGASFDTHMIVAKTHKELREKYNEHLEYEYGHQGYSGTLKECGGLVIKERTFDTEEEAVKYIEDTHQKWNAAIAVRLTGTDIYIIGGWCSI